jgi:anti-sigma factor RsiW
MSEQTSPTPEPDEPAPVVEPVSADPGDAATAEHAAAPLAGGVPPPVPPTPTGWVPGRPRSGFYGRRRPRWAAPFVTGMVGLIIGMIIGAAVVGVIGIVVRHAHHGPSFRGDNRAHHSQYNRPGPATRPGPGIPFHRLGTQPAAPTPTPTPS